MKTLTFNTGRGYTEHGQRIAATKLDDGRVLFVDVDRGIDYVSAEPIELTSSAVMAAYDYGRTGWIYDALPDYAERERVLGELRDAARAVRT
jgi:hypothetical protein